MQIIPIRELKNTAKISKVCNDNNQPLFVTKNGYGDLVIMSMQAYEQQQDELTIMRRLFDEKAETIDGNTAKEQLRKIYE